MNDLQTTAATALSCLMGGTPEDNALAAHGLKKHTANELRAVQDAARKLMLLCHIHLQLGEYVRTTTQSQSDSTGPSDRG